MKRALSIMLCLLCFKFINARLSGLYIDNGLDQTIIQRVLTKQEKQNVEHEILNLLGLRNRPRPVTNSKTLGSSAPKFLLDIYRSLLDNPSGRSTRSELTLSGTDLHAIDESDAIMTFTCHNNHVSQVRHERGKRLWFDVSEVPVDETIVNAELRLYQNANYTVRLPTTYTVTIYQVLLDGSEKELEYIDSTNTTTGNEGWLLFNMTGPLTNWVVFPKTNRGLYLSVHAANRLSREMQPEDIGIVLAGDRESEKQPFMVGFFKTIGVNNKKRNRKTRELHRRKKSDTESSYPRNPFSEPVSLWSTRSCQMQSLYVNFRDLQWHDWIIAPDGYHAYYCGGECDFPLNAHMNATNHAIVQTLVNLLHPEVPKPYCAPTKLSPMSVLYYVHAKDVILKKYNNMVVKSCGCH